MCSSKRSPGTTLYGPDVSTIPPKPLGSTIADAIKPALANSSTCSAVDNFGPHPLTYSTQNKKLDKETAVQPKPHLPGVFTKYLPNYQSN
jgi:hypothetical protein